MWVISMKLFVTGGAGFIGSNFVRHSVSKGHKVTVVDKLTYSGNLDNIRDLDQKSYEFIHADICDESLMRTGMKNADAVVHFAAESHVTRSETDPEVFYRTNVEGTRTLLKCATETGVKKFVHISTDEVYGSRPDGLFQESDKLIGDSQASSPYSKSKSLADDLAMSYSSMIPLIVVRPTNNFGPRQYPEKALPRWVTRLLTGKNIPVWGKGENVRDWLHVGNTVKAIEFLIERGRAGEAYNIAANNKPEIRNIDIANWLIETLRFDPARIEFVPDPRPNHDFRYAIDTRKIHSLGFTMDQDVRKLVEETVNWYVENRAWWTRLLDGAESIYSDIKDNKGKRA